MMEDYSGGDDSEEEFNFYQAPRHMLPSYYDQLYSCHKLATGGGDANDDDGWDSSDESCMPVIPAPVPDQDESKQPKTKYSICSIYCS